jgi:hypothetical protein
MTGLGVTFGGVAFDGVGLAGAGCTGSGELFSTVGFFDPPETAHAPSTPKIDTPSATAP